MCVWSNIGRSVAVLLKLVRVPTQFRVTTKVTTKNPLNRCKNVDITGIRIVQYKMHGYYEMTGYYEMNGNYAMTE